jgi:DNA-binding MarR family transcriptional regulator
MNAHDADSAIGLFYYAWRGLTTARDRTLAKRGYGQIHHRVLFTIARAPGVRVGELASTLRISRQALHRPLSELIRDDLVLSRITAGSARERALELSRAGALLEQRVTATQRLALERALGTVERDALVGWLAVMRALAEPQLATAPIRARQWLALPARAAGDPQRRSEPRSVRRRGT